MDSHQTESVDPDEPILDLSVLAPGTLVASRYEIEHLLGSGGFARVYAARDIELGQRIAIKILRSDRMTPATLARLRREVSIAREIPRETLVRVYDLGQDGDHVFLTMELVEGETLRDRIRRGLPDIGEIARMSEPILDGLGALHAAGVVHRDLKPANILLTPSGAVKLADFGLARRWEGGEKVTRTEALVGTLEYVAPEQALGKQLDGRADLYAFGVLLFEMLTGKLPLEAATNLGTVMAHIVSTAPDVRTLRPDTPAWLAELIQRLMEKEPGARPQTTSEVLEIIRARKRDFGWRWKRSRARVLVYLLATLAIAAFGVLAWGAYWSSFDHVESDAGRHLRALDRRGRLLWESEALVPESSAAVVKVDGSTPSIVGVPDGANGSLPENRKHAVQIYSASTGEITKRLTVTDVAYRFPLEPTFALGGMTAVDPDHDGREDVLITYVHTPYWPSYNVYLDPRTAQSTAVFIASGHHRPAGSVDLDGDGIDELLFTGPNNRMGWFTGIAAVKLVRQSGKATTTSPWIEAGSPDAEYSRESHRALLWYSLQPRMSVHSCKLTLADKARRTLRFECSADNAFELSYDGFAAGSTSSLEPAARRAARESAYTQLRQALRVGVQGNSREALDLIGRARLQAESAGDGLLGEWITTNEAILLARAGRYAEAESLFERIATSSDAPWEICLQAGQVFETRGEFDRAARFYREGINLGTKGVWSGRVGSDHLVPLVLVLAQQQRWDEASEEIAKYASAFPESSSIVPCLRAFVDWRRGSAIMDVLQLDESQPALYNYWTFETRWAAGVADAAAFLRELEEYRKRSSDLGCLFASLESEVLFRLGRDAEAAALARTAMKDTLAAAETNPEVRAHVAVVRARAERVK